MKMKEKHMVSFLDVVKYFSYSIRTAKRLSFIVVGLSLVTNMYAQKLAGERRVYYLDATYSMVTPSKLWNPVRKDLAKAINAIEDETTEIYVVAFGGNRGTELKVWNDFATEEGKAKVIHGFMGFDPKRNTMTYLDRPLSDFYSNRVDSKKVTYCFLMTDGKDENQDSARFPNVLRQWGGKYGDTNVYGFYVMLNEEARDSNIESIIDKQEHLWKVETADVNINLIRLANEAVYNIRTDKVIKIPFESGKCSGMTIKASLPEESGLKVKNSEIKDDCLVVEVDVIGSQSSMAEVSNWPLFLSVSNVGKFDFLVTEKVSVKCNNKHEYVLTSPTGRQKWGKVSHYDEFWFVSGKVKPVEHSLSFKFNEDAKAQSNSFAEFAFVDNKGRRIEPTEMNVWVDGILLDNNRILITPSDENIDIKLSFPSEVKRGNRQGYLRLINHNLHRLNNDECTGEVIDAFQWTVYNDKDTNPLKLCLIYISIILGLAFLFWMCILKPMFYPRFGSIQKTFNVPGMAPLIMKFKGARMIVVSATPQRKQSGWNRFWTGRIVYKIHPAFVNPIAFTPSRGRRILVKAQSGSYRIMPNPMPGVGAATIIEINKNLTINVN